MGELAPGPGGLYGITVMGNTANYTLGSVFRVATGSQTPTVETVLEITESLGKPPTGIVSVGPYVYVATQSYGAFGYGTVSRFQPQAANPASTVQIVHEFKAWPPPTPDGGSPIGLDLDAQGNVVGTTSYGGDHSGGVIFRISDPGGAAPQYSVVAHLRRSVEGAGAVAWRWAPTDPCTARPLAPGRATAGPSTASTSRASRSIANLRWGFVALRAGGTSARTSPPARLRAWRTDGTAGRDRAGARPLRREPVVLRPGSPRWTPSCSAGTYDRRELRRSTPGRSHEARQGRQALRTALGRDRGN